MGRLDTTSDFKQLTRLFMKMTKNKESESKISRWTVLISDGKLIKLIYCDVSGKRLREKNSFGFAFRENGTV